MGQRLRRLQPKPRVAKPSGPYVGMKDSIDLETNEPQFARLIEDMIPDIGPQGSALIGRPADENIDMTGIVGAGPFTITNLKQTGSSPLVVVLSEDGIWTRAQGAASWTQHVTAANFASAGITYGGDIFTEQFGDVLVVNGSGSGTKPWTFDASKTGAASLSILTNAPLAFGQPVVHYAKLFLIKQGDSEYDRRTIVWSEEVQPNLGYDSGGYNNAWDLKQVDEDPLFALYPTNKGLYYFRQASIGVIFGEVTINFSSTGVDDAISETIGTPFPASILRVDTVQGTQIWFLDERNRPHYLTVGGTLTPAWLHFKDTLKNATPLEPGVDISLQRSWRLPNEAVIGLPFGGPNTPTKYMIFDSETASPLAVWNGTMRNAEIIYEGRDKGELWYDYSGQLVSVTGDPTDGGVVETAAFYEDALTEIYWDTLEIMGRGEVVSSAAVVTPITPYAEHDPIALNDEALSGTTFGTTSKETIGLSHHGRWIRFRLENLPGSAGLSRLIARGAIYSDSASIP